MYAFLTDQTRCSSCVCDGLLDKWHLSLHTSSRNLHHPINVRTIRRTNVVWRAPTVLLRQEPNALAISELCVHSFSSWLPCSQARYCIKGGHGTQHHCFCSAVCMGVSSTKQCYSYAPTGTGESAPNATNNPECTAESAGGCCLPGTMRHTAT